ARICSRGPHLRGALLRATYPFLERSEPTSGERPISCPRLQPATDRISDGHSHVFGNWCLISRVSALPCSALHTSPAPIRCVVPRRSIHVESFARSVRT